MAFGTIAPLSSLCRRHCGGVPFTGTGPAKRSLSSLASHSLKSSASTPERCAEERNHPFPSDNKPHHFEYNGIRPVAQITRWIN